MAFGSAYATKITIVQPPCNHSSFTEKKRLQFFSIWKTPKYLCGYLSDCQASIDDIVLDHCKIHSRRESRPSGRNECRNKKRTNYDERRCSRCDLWSSSVFILSLLCITLSSLQKLLYTIDRWASGPIQDNAFCHRRSGVVAGRILKDNSTDEGSWSINLFFPESNGRRSYNQFVCLVHSKHQD